MKTDEILKKNTYKPEKNNSKILEDDPNTDENDILYINIHNSNQ